MIRFDHSVCGDLEQALRREWLETNGLGGFASSTIVGLNTRRYHALLTAALHPPADRMVLLSKLEETLIVGERRYELSANQYPGVIHPTGFVHLREFRLDPFPIFVWQIDGVELEKSLLLVHGENTVVVTWALRTAADEGVPVALEVRPLIAFRDFHATTHENDALDRRVTLGEGVASVTPYAGLPTLHVAHDASDVVPTGDWYRSFEYPVERARGLDCHEDLYQPFTLRFTLRGSRRATVIAGTEPRAARDADGLIASEQARRAALVAEAPEGDDLQQTLLGAADQYLARRGDGKTIIAGYPWFTDWGRDTFIALRGLCLATGRLDEARDILLAWAGVVSEGMLPNRFRTTARQPEYNSVDAVALVRGRGARVPRRGSGGAAGRCATRAKPTRSGGRSRRFSKATRAARATAIGVDASDGLRRAGEPGVQLTWMDAKVGDWVVTPRTGKPVEIQALWLAALQATARALPSAGRSSSRAAARSFARALLERSRGLPVRRRRSCGHAPARSTASFRPNQIFASAACRSCCSTALARASVVDAVEARLWTPLGLRSLAPGEPGYVAHYVGDVRAARRRVPSGNRVAVAARSVRRGVGAGPRWLERGQAGGARALPRAACSRTSPTAGSAHVSEIADAEAPHDAARLPVSGLVGGRGAAPRT